MTPTQLKEAAQVMLAASEGKQVQFRYGEGSMWEDVYGDPGWNWHIRTYRIKPEAREWWLDLRNGRFYAAPCPIPDDDIIKVREVI